MMFKATSYLAVTLVCLSILFGHAPSHSQDVYYEAPYRPEPNPEEYRYVLPMGTHLPLLLQEPISTETAIVGQPVSALISQDIYIGNKKVLSQADRVLGTVSEIQPPTQGRNAILKLTFSELVLSNGLRMPFQTHTHTGHPKHIWGGELTPGTEPQKVAYNIHRIGSYNRIIYRGPRAMGQHVSLYPGNRLVIVLDSNVTLYVI